MLVPGLSGTGRTDPHSKMDESRAVIARLSSDLSGKIALLQGDACELRHGAGKVSCPTSTTTRSTPLLRSHRGPISTAARRRSRPKPAGACRKLHLVP